MAELIANSASSRRPAATVTGFGQLTVNHGAILLASALAANDTIALVKLPAGHVPVDFILDTDDLDTNGTAAIVLDVGLLGEGATGDEFIDATNIGRTGGVERLSNRAGRRIAPVDYDRLVGVTVKTAPATGATNVTVQGTLLSRPAGIDD